MPLIPPHPVELPVAHPAALDRAAEMILAAKHPLIMIGAAASRPQLAEHLSAFVRRTRLPFFNTQMGKGAVTGGSNLYMGTAALSERDYVHRAIDRADLIIAIGHDTIEKPPFIMGEGGPQVIHVGYHVGQCRAGLPPARRGDRRYRAEPALCWPTGLRASCSPTQSDLLGLRAGHPGPHQRSGGRGPLPGHAAAARARRPRGDAGGRDRVPRQRHVQDLVRPQLPHPCRQHAAARQCARHDGGRACPRP